MTDKIIVNENPEENPDFDFKNLNSLKNHWLKIKGKLINGKK